MSSAAAQNIDPITLEVVRNKLEGIAEEMQQTLLRSSFSPIVKEGLDASASLFTLTGETLAEACAIPVHLGTLIPVVAILGPVLAILVTGSIVIESVFEIPGMGSLYLLAITSRDYGVIMSMTLIYTFAIAGLNLVVDLFYGLIDPRIREAPATA